MTEERAIEVATRAANWAYNIKFSGICPVCGEIFFTGSSLTKVCSLGCLRGEFSRTWKGGRNKCADGYVKISSQKGHPRADRCYRVFEHILVMEKKIGRYLRDKESVHHINGIKDDNRPENLELMIHHPSGQRVEDLLNIMINDYPKELLRKLKIKGII